MWSSNIVPPPQVAGFAQWQAMQQQQQQQLQAAQLHANQLNNHQGHYHQHQHSMNKFSSPTEGDAYRWHNQNHQQNPPMYEPPRQARRVEESQTADHRHHHSSIVAASYHPPMSSPLHRGDIIVPVAASRRVVNPEMYDKFCETRTVGDMQRGVFFLSQFVNGQAAQPQRPPSPGGTVTVDLELWNNYWAAFSEEISYHEDDVRSFLKSQESMSGNEIGAGVGKLNRRRVIIKSPMPIHSVIPPGFSEDTLIAHILSMACHFGVVEAARVSVDEVRVQFTTSTAAILFASFVRSVDTSAIFPSHFGQQQDSLQATPAANAPLRASRLVNVFLVEHRYTTPASSGASGPRRLILGRKLDIPSIFLNALLRDLFEATTIEYNTGAFVVEFSSHAAAKYALHVLQKSFRMVFGLTLSFYEPGDPVLNFFA